jgi:hypothetical protein
MKKKISFGIAILVSTVLWGQNKLLITGIEQTISFSQLNNHFRSYQVFTSSMGTRRSENLTELSLRLGTISVSFKMKDVTGVTNDSILVRTDNEQRLDISGSLVHFRGEDEMHDQCRISINDHFILGSFRYNNDDYGIEQVMNFVRGADPDLIVVYKIKDIIEQPIRCGNPEPVSVYRGDNIGSADGITRACRVVDYAIAVDYSEYVNRGSSIDQTADYILSVMNLAEGNFIGPFTDDIHFKISEIFIFTNPMLNPWPFTNDVFDNLDNFVIWAPYGFTKPFDLASYWISAPPDSVAGGGAAWLGKICSTDGKNTNVIVDTKADAQTMRCVVAHETGHNFGCGHTTGDYIMSPGAGPTPSAWAQVSIAIIDSTLSDPTKPCISVCDYSACEKEQVSGLAITDDGSQFVLQWAATENPVSVEYRNRKSGNFTLAGIYNPPATSATIPHDTACGASQYFQIKVAPVCPNSNLGEPIIAVEQSTGHLRVTPSITISANDTVVCEGAEVTFTAVSANGGTNPIYQWKKNGVTIGTNSPFFILSSPADNDEISCTLTSNETCITSNNIESNKIKVIVPGVDPLIVRNGNTLTASPVIAGVAWQWYKDGQLIAGATNSTYTVSQYGEYFVTETFKTCSKSSALISIGSIAPAGDEMIRIFQGSAGNVLFAQTSNNALLIRRVNIYDTKGSEVFTKTFPGNNLVQFNLSPTLSGGLYIAVFETNLKKISVKFIK